MSLLRLSQLNRLSFGVYRRAFSALTSRRRELKSTDDINAYLSSSSWSVRSLIPSEADIASTTSQVTPVQLQHLLRLSALPPPSSPEQEANMLRDLHGQLHFVEQIQKVVTEGVEPLQALRDESNTISDPMTGKVTGEIGLAEMKEALAQEEVVGKHHKRIRRRRGMADEQAKKAEDWDVLGQAGKRLGRYFVVESEREGEKGST